MSVSMQDWYDQELASQKADEEKNMSSGFDPVSIGISTAGSIVKGLLDTAAAKKKAHAEVVASDLEAARREAEQGQAQTWKNEERDSRREWAVKLMQAMQPSAGFDTSFADMLPGLGAAMKGQLGAKGNQLFGTGTAAKFDFSKLLSALAKHNPDINASNLPINKLMLGGGPQVTTPPLNPTPNPLLKTPSHYDELVKRYGGGFNSGGPGGGFGGNIY